MTLGSPAELHLYDTEGRHVGPTSAGNVDLDIPGARYFQTTAPEHTVIFVPDAGPATDYRVQVMGTGSGKMDIETFVGDRQSSTVSHQAYLGIPVAPNTQAELELHPTDSVPLGLDTDGDGTFETQQASAKHDVVRIYEAEESILDKMSSAVRGITDRPVLPGTAGAAFVLVIVVVLWRRRRRTGGPPSRFCPHCGAQVSRPTSRFCGQCGARLR